MRSRSIFKIGVFFGFFCIVANAQNPPPVTPAAERIPLVTVEIEQEGNEAPDPFTITITVANTTTTTIYLKEFKSIIPPSLRSSGVTNAQSFSAANLPSGHKIVVRIPVPPVAPYRFTMLTFIASNLKVGASVAYAVGDLDEQRREIEKTVATKWQGSLTGKVFGGIVGCFALALFISSQHLANKTLSGAAFRAFSGSFVSIFLLGLATVVAACLLTAFLAPGDLPVRFSVEDWRGGALLGLFSIPLATWLREKLSPKARAQRQQEKIAH